MNILFLVSFLIIIVILFPIGLIICFFLRKRLNSIRSLWSYSMVLALVSLAVFLSFYLVFIGIFKTNQAVLLMSSIFVILTALIILFFQKGWLVSEKILTSFFGVVAFLVILTLSFHYSIFSPFIISDTGMNSVYGNGNFVFCRIDRGIISSEYSRGDIVIMQAPNDKTKSVVRKIVGIAGDTVKISGGQLLVNDQAARGVRANELIVPVALEKGQYFVLAENQENMPDSITFGPVKKSDIYAKVLFKMNWLKKWDKILKNK